MNIGIDVRLWNETGVGRYIRNLVVGLGKTDKKNTYTLFVRSQDKKNIQETLGESAKKFHFIPADIRWHTLSEQINFARIINKSSVDLVHFPYFSLPVFSKKPYIVTIHDVIIHHFPTGKASTLPLPLYKLKHIGYRQVVAQAAKRSQKIIVPLQATKDEVIKTLGIPEKKIIVTREGVDEHIAPTREAEEQVRRLLKDHKSFFLYVGNAYPHKNLPRLLKAFTLYQKTSTTNTALVLVGKEDYFYERLQKTVHNPAVMFLHDISDAELAVLYQQAKALCLPSLMEGFGLPALEAMKHGCLVVASDIPALREVCGRAGIYCDPFHAEDIAEKLLEVEALPAKEIETLQKNGKEKARTYSWERMVEETIAVYESSHRL